MGPNIGLYGPCGTKRHLGETGTEPNKHLGEMGAAANRHRRKTGTWGKLVPVESFRHWNTWALEQTGTWGRMGNLTCPKCSGATFS